MQAVPGSVLQNAQVQNLSSRSVRGCARALRLLSGGDGIRFCDCTEISQAPTTGDNSIQFDLSVTATIRRWIYV